MKSSIIGCSKQMSRSIHRVKLKISSRWNWNWNFCFAFGGSPIVWVSCGLGVLPDLNHQDSFECVCVCLGVCQFCRLTGIACANHCKQLNWRNQSAAHATCGNNSGNFPHPTRWPSRAAAIDRPLYGLQLTAMWQAPRPRQLELLRWPWAIMSTNAPPSASRVRLSPSARPAALWPYHKRRCHGINRWLCRQ